MTHGVRPAGREGSGTLVARLRAVERSVRGLVWHGGRAVPSLLAALLIFLALRPMLFEPELRLDGLLASMAGVGLSFASVALSAATALRERCRWSRAMVGASLMLLRFALAIVLALALVIARRRLAADFSFAVGLDWALRVAMTLVTALAIVFAFLGFRSLISLLGPGLEMPEDPAPASPPSADGSDSDAAP